LILPLRVFTSAAFGKTMGTKILASGASSPRNQGVVFLCPYRRRQERRVVDRSAPEQLLEASAALPAHAIPFTDYWVRIRTRD
jgi:hypothetical protein